MLKRAKDGNVANERPRECEQSAESGQSRQTCRWKSAKCCVRRRLFVVVLIGTMSDSE
jgi:hypothetical protein